MLELNKDNFKKEIEDYKEIALVDFWAPWCGPCQQMGLVVEELAEKYKGKAKVAKLNIDENQAIAAKYDIMSIPTVIFFKGGKEVKRTIGMRAKNVIAEMIEEIRNKN
jgi:thioredoxin 1